MTLKHILALLAVAGLMTASFADLAQARGHHGGHRHCRMGHHLDYGSNRCVRNG